MKLLGSKPQITSGSECQVGHDMLSVLLKGVNREVKVYRGQAGNSSEQRKKHSPKNINSANQTFN